MVIPPLERILLVEDDPDIQIVVKAALEARGRYTVKICDSGQEALQVAPSFMPDMILLDVMMPKMDGPATFAQLRKLSETSCTPVVFVSARVQPHEVAYYKTLGALDVICKPFKATALSNTLQELWERFHHAGEKSSNSDLKEL